MYLRSGILYLLFNLAVMIYYLYMLYFGVPLNKTYKTLKLWKKLIEENFEKLWAPKVPIVFINNFIFFQVIQNDLHNIV